ncbi:hypothetical protein [Bremerella cremea]|uniref:hypothetical protein n=1 Tax=Bremerella cremea TaxID=1031537 RepID=UPI0031E72E1E
MRSDLPHVTCPECGAENNSFANNCWICRHPLHQNDELIERELLAPPPMPATRRPWVPNLALALLIVATCLVALGVSSDSAGALITFAIFVLPIAVACGVVIYQGSQSENKAFRTISEIFSTLIVTVGAMILLGIAGIIALFAFCLMLFTGLAGR